MYFVRSVEQELNYGYWVFFALFKKTEWEIGKRRTNKKKGWFGRYDGYDRYGGKKYN